MIFLTHAQLRAAQQRVAEANEAADAATRKLAALQEQVQNCQWLNFAMDAPSHATLTPGCGAAFATTSHGIAAPLPGAPWTSAPSPAAAEGCAPATGGARQPVGPPSSPADEALIAHHRKLLDDLSSAHHREIHLLTSEIAEREAFMATLADHLPCRIAYWQRDLRCRFANRAYAEWFGQTVDDIVGITLDAITPDSYVALNRPQIDAVLAGTPQCFHRTMTSADGSVSHTIIHYIPDYAQDEVVGFLVLINDVTALKETEIQVRETNRRLEAALAQAEVATLAKNRFLATTSHEIRTPINAIIGFFDLALAGKLPDNVRRHLTAGETAARGLLALVDDVLDISRLESGRLELEHTVFNLRNELFETVERARRAEPGHPASVDIDFSPDLPPWYVGDALRVRQIVTKLVGNALKFTRQGQVRVSLYPAHGAGGMLELVVADTGIGMSPEQVRAVFDPFGQADSSTTRQYEGIGLGLAICQRLVALMNGRIWVDSEPGRGSTFHAVFHLDVAGTHCAANTVMSGAIANLPQLAGINIAAGLQRWQTLPSYLQALDAFIDGFETLPGSLYCAAISGAWRDAAARERDFRDAAINLGLSELAAVATALETAIDNEKIAKVEEQVCQLAAAWETMSGSAATLKRLAAEQAGSDPASRHHVAA